MHRATPVVLALVLLAAPAWAAFPAKVAKSYAACLDKGGAEEACKQEAYDDFVRKCTKLDSAMTCEAMARTNYAVDPSWTPEAFEASVAALGAAESHRMEGTTSAMLELAVTGGACLSIHLDSPGPDRLAGQVYGEGLWVAEMSGHRFEVGSADESIDVCFDRSGTATLQVSAIHHVHRTVLSQRALQVAVGVDRRKESLEAATARQAEQTASIERQLAERAARAAAARQQAIAHEKSEHGLLVAFACEICREARDACEAGQGTECRSSFEACGLAVGIDTFGGSVCLDGR